MQTRRICSQKFRATWTSCCGWWRLTRGLWNEPTHLLFMGELNETSQFLIRHGLPLIFAVVLVEQMGLPIPALPVLLAAGALSASGKFSLLLGIVATVIACLIADALWFYLGRYRGNQVLGFLCRISLEPDSCVRRTQNVFTRYGLRGVVVAKFVPGMSTVAPPLVGMARVHAGRF